MRTCLECLATWTRFRASHHDDCGSAHVLVGQVRAGARVAAVHESAGG
jgi:hypothetical protein